MCGMATAVGQYDRVGQAAFALPSPALHIGAEAEEFLAFHLSPSRYDGRFFIGALSKKSGMRDVYKQSAADVAAYAASMEINPQLNYYITCNSMKGVSRGTEQLFAVHNIVIDIDCHEIGVNPAPLLQSFLWRMDKDAFDTHIPQPNSIVWTGRGLQLWWAINPVYAPRCSWAVDRIRNAYITLIRRIIAADDNLSQLDADSGASGNLAGYFRLPGTYNTHDPENPIFVRVDLRHKTRYDTETLLPQARELQSSLDDHTEDTTLQGVDLSPPLPAVDFAGAYSDAEVYILRTPLTTGLMRVRQMIDLRKLRGQAVGAETRNNYIFVVYNSLLPALGHDAAMKRVKAFNAEFARPMTDKELDATVCSCKQKGGYKYSNEKLIKLLGVTPEEQVAIGLHVPTQPYSPFARMAPSATRNQTRRLLKTDRNNKIIALYKQGEKIGRIAAAVGVAAATATAVIKGAHLEGYRDQQVLDLLAAGHTGAEIADKLGIDQRTVRRIKAAAVNDAGGQNLQKRFYI